MKKNAVAQLLAEALEDMDLRSMTALLELVKKALREDIEEYRRMILERERWDRAPVVMSDYTSPEQDREQQLVSLNRWHDERLKQLKFVHRIYHVVASMHDKNEAAAAVAAVLADRRR